MMKRNLRWVIFLIAIQLIAINGYTANAPKNESSSRSSNFEKSAFSTSKTTTSDVQRIGPPGPGGGGGGTPIPINGGMAILVIGSVAFWTLKVRKQLKHE